ncbi:MAG: serine protease [Bacteroidia bacterium]|nr:MAG: serine protease [Bacteroidia bacterium]
MVRVRTPGPLALVLLLGIAALIQAPATGQEIPPPPPELTTVLPAAIQRGSEATLTVTGSNLTEIRSILFSAPGLEAELARQVNDRTVELKVKCAPDAPVGLAELRLVTTHGVSNCRYLYVDTVPVLEEKEPNTVFAAAQLLESLPVGVAGRITGSDRDFFRFYAKAGQKIVFEAVGRRLLPFLRIDDRIGWFDPYLELYDSSGHQLATADDFRMQPDATLIYEFATDGEYVLCVRDAAYRGRNEFMYYLRIGELPYVTNWFPLGGTAGTKVQLSLAGVNAPTTATVDLPTSPLRLSFFTHRLATGEHTTNAIELAVDQLASQAEQEPNDDRSHAQEIPVPVAIDGLIGQAADEDWFRLVGKKGQRLAAEIVARRVGSPMDAVIDLYRSNGQRIAGNDDAEARPGYLQNADSRLVVTLPADDTYFVRVRDLARLGGDDYGYRLVLYAPSPDFEAYLVPTDPFITNPRLTIAQTVARAVPVGGTAAFRVRVRRIDGLNHPVQVNVKGLPEGVEARTAPLASGQNETWFTISAADGLAPGTIVPLTVELTTESDGATLLRQAIPLESHSYVADQRQEFPVALAVTAVSSPLPFRIEPDPLDATLKKGEAVRIKVRCIRNEDLTVPVQITADTPPRGITISNATLAPDKQDVELEVKAAGNLAPGQYGIVLVGTAKIKNQDVRVYSKLLLLTVQN